MQAEVQTILTIDTDELARRAQEFYDRELRKAVETAENIGKILVLDVASGDYEIDEMGIETARRLQAKHPGAPLFAFRIGYKTGESFSGMLERTVAE